MDTIYAIVPDELNAKKSELSVSLYSKQSENSKTFEIHSPVVNSISKSEGQYPDNVIVFGEFFSTSRRNPITVNLIIDQKSYNAGTVLNKGEILLKIPFIGLDLYEYLSLEIIQLGERLFLKDFFRTNEQSIVLTSDSVALAQDIRLKTINCDMRQAAIQVSLNNNFIPNNLININETELIFPASGGTFDDKTFNIDLYFDDQQIYSTDITQAGPLIKEIYNQQVTKNGTLDLYVIAVNLSRKCLMQWKNSEGVIFETIVSQYYNRTLWIPEFRAVTTLSDEITPGEYTIRLSFYDRYSDWHKVTVLLNEEEKNKHQE